MKKIGIVTLFHRNFNYGAALQAYALEEALKSLGLWAEVLDYRRCVRPLSVMPPESTLHKIRRKLTIRSVGDAADLALRPFIGAFQASNQEKLKERERKFFQFYQEHMHISQDYDSGTIAQANEHYDMFVCGSDQVWRPSSFDPNFFLAFAGKEKQRFSYAASLGVRKLSDQAAETMIPLIDSLDMVSVREDEAKDLLSDYTNKPIETVLDPTLLFDEAFWAGLATEVKGLSSGKYVFCYLIGENNKNRALAKKIAKKYDLPLVTIPAVSRVLPYDMLYADQNLIDTSPDEFLWLIKNAAAVVTDSFHASVFSILFHKSFHILERFRREDSLSMNGRIYHLLDLFGWDDVLVGKPEEIRLWNAHDIRNNENLSAARKTSWDYLRRALENGSPENDAFALEQERRS